MVTKLDPRQGAEKGLKPYRISVEQFEKMIDAGVFPDRPRVELLGGLLFRNMTKNDPHNNFAVGFMGSVLNRLLEPAGWLRKRNRSSWESSGAPSRILLSFEGHASVIVIAHRETRTWAS
jgi:hypothetical protein